MDMGRVGRGFGVGDAERESMAGVEGALEPESGRISERTKHVAISAHHDIACKTLLTSRLGELLDSRVDLPTRAEV